MARQKKIKETKDTKKQPETKQKKINISYKCKLFLYLTLFICLTILATYFIIKAINITHDEKITLTEQGDIDYTVCLNENEFYEKKCLEKNKSYITSLINNITLKFNYKLGGNKEYINNPIKYKIIGNLIIKNKDTSSTYYEKEYTLKQEEKITDTNNLYYVINDEIKINYDYYNEIANSFKSKYGVETESYLEISYIINNEIDSKYNIPKENKLKIKIPLSTKTIQIEPYNITNTYENNTIEKNITIANKKYFIFGIFLLINSISSLIIFISLLRTKTKKKSIYDKKIAKILKEYDRLIVETRSLPNFSEYNLLKINKFEELVDVRDNLKLPIMYYEVHEHQQSYFYILNERNLYVYILKEADLINHEKK